MAKNDLLTLHQYLGEIFYLKSLWMVICKDTYRGAELLLSMCPVEKYKRLLVDELAKYGWTTYPFIKRILGTIKQDFEFLSVILIRKIDGEFPAHHEFHNIFFSPLVISRLIMHVGLKLFLSEIEEVFKQQILNK